MIPPVDVELLPSDVVELPPEPVVAELPLLEADPVDDVCSHQRLTAEPAERNLFRALRL